MTSVVIDIGHGTDTPGKGVGIHKEHDFNSKLGLAIKRILEQHNVGVIFGQQPFSKEVPMRTRTNFYNSTNAVLSVSLHANANSNASVNGRCVFYWHDNADAERLAKNVRNEIRDAGYSTHGTGLHESRTGSWTNLHMVREPKMPAILIEHGFMTGNKDFSLIFGADQGTYIRDMAEADSRAILDYLGKQYNEPKERVEVVMSGELYRVQVGAFASKENAERLAAELKAKGYPVFIPDANTVTVSESKPAPKPKPVAIKAGDRVMINSSASRYATGETIPASRKKPAYTVMQATPDRVLLKEIMSWVYRKDVRKA